MIPKFRAWDILAEEMINEMLLISYVRKEIVGKYRNGTTSVPLKFEDDRNGKDVVLMQSTGLKDKNGQEIFEGDILTDGHTTGVLRNHQALGFYMVDEKEKERFLSDTVDTEDFEEAKEFMGNSIEIIGNVHQNPELLEADHDRD
ncbi:YopX family protein [Streptococcus gordonii]|uniref:YopX family protein n=1 Tax=Streptococcus gordonii TaxID=1302 RepID=UPI001C8B5F11|nr:YopX family protein [Streptococcus gordonii]MBX9096400.1 hypothetical protein [Streptococcus gordonii]